MHHRCLDISLKRSGRSCTVCLYAFILMLPRRNVTRLKIYLYTIFLNETGIFTVSVLKLASVMAAHSIRSIVSPAAEYLELVHALPSIDGQYLSVSVCVSNVHTRSFNLYIYSIKARMRLVIKSPQFFMTMSLQ